MTALFSLALLLAPPAAAAPPVVPVPVPMPQGSIMAEPVAMMIAAFDRDGDARVTRAEFDEGVRTSFADGDASRQSMSMIDLSHWAVRWLGNQGAVPGQFDFDRDADNAISRAEYAAQFDRSFARFDINRDQVLERSELITMATPRLPPLRGERREVRRQRN